MKAEVVPRQENTADETALSSNDSLSVKPLSHTDDIDSSMAPGLDTCISNTDSEDSTTTSRAWSSRWLDTVDRASFREVLSAYCEQRADLVNRLNSLPRPSSPDADDGLTEDMLKLAARFSSTKPMQLRCFRNIPESMLGFIEDEDVSSSSR
jgi:hypothetical protein